MASTGASINANGIAGASITAGMVVYQDSTTTPANKYKGADANLSAAASTVFGIALHAAEDGQPLSVITAGELTLGAGAAPAAGTVYVLSATTGGKIAPTGDLASGWYLTVLGYGKGSNKIQVQITNSGVAVP